MKDEIKEILDELKYISNDIKVHIQDENIKSKEIPSSMVKELRLNSYSAKLLLDYITNLRKIEKDHQKLNGELREELKGYKQERERILNKLDYVKKNKELQEENEKLKESNERRFRIIDTMENALINLDDYIDTNSLHKYLVKKVKENHLQEGDIEFKSKIKELNDYKSRNEKAMELLKEFYDSGSCPLRNISKAYEILNGDDTNVKD